MSERTTIGGTVYETVGSSTSNLLLRCNGTARIQWGTKLIDLVKNGKIASGDSSAQISVVSNESDIKTDGIYVVNAEKSSRLIIRKNSENYDFTDTELYISANNKQELTVEQQKQAMENIGMYYNTLDDVEKSGIQNGIVYVLEDRSLYTIKDGVILEFEAKLKTVSVEKENEDGERINSSVQVVLSVLDKDYLVLKDKRITAKQSVHVPSYLQLGSENATDITGYRLYFKNGESWLDVDNINVRNGITVTDYTEVTFTDLQNMINQNKLKPHNWYVISDYQNVWRVPANNSSYNRPIMIRALDGSSLYPEGMLFDDRRITIKYDPTYCVSILCNDGTPVKTKGKITWMKDFNNNEANFDFLDYSDDFGNPMTTLHYTYSTIQDSTGTPFLQIGHKSVFPVNSHDNKLTIHNLKGTIVKNGKLDNTNTFTVDFKVKDSPKLTSTESVSEELVFMDFYNNNIECYGLTTSENCVKFFDNEINNSGVIKFNLDCYNNTLSRVYNNSTNVTTNDLSSVLTETIFHKEVCDTTIKTCSNSSILGSLVRSTFNYIALSQINGDISNSSFKDISNCIINAVCNRVTFNTLNTCTIDVGTLENLTCRSDLASIPINSVDHPLLYDTSKIKDVYYINGQFQIVDSANLGFPPGVIVMHSGIGIPEGWAPCDGNEYEYQGQKYRTPNLVGRFIKAVGTYAEIGEGNVHNAGKNNEFTLEEHHLPAHTHPHKAHTHTISGITGTLSESGDLAFAMPTHISDVEVNTNSVTLAGGENAVITEVNSQTESGIISGGNHTHNLTILGGSVSSVSSTESNKVWSNKSFNIEPNYYSLIFIIKL